MGRDGDWENMGPKGCINSYGISVYQRCFGCFRMHQLVICPLVDAKGSATEGSFHYIYNLTEWKCDQRIELGRGLSYNTNA